MKKVYKEDILRLRKEGMSYNEIVKELGCSKATVAYWLGTGQRAKAKARNLRNYEANQGKKTALREKLQEFSWRYKKMCGCAHCGIRDPRVLEYDHIRDKDYTITQMITNRITLERVKEEIRKCQVLCANCHRIKTHKDLNFYKR